MRRLFFALVLGHIIALAPTVASASVKVTIAVLNADGTTFQSLSTSTAAFTLSGTTVPADATRSGNKEVNILVGSSPRFFPTGGTTAAASDTFKLENISTSNLFRCAKTDPQVTTTNPNPAQLLEVKGLKATVTSAGSGKKLRVTCTNDAGDYRVLNSTSGTYSLKAALKGEVRTHTPNPLTPSQRNVAKSCVPAAFFTSGTPTFDATTLQNPCLKLELSINSIAVNGQGLSTSLTTSISCSNTLKKDTNGDGTLDTLYAPCGVGGTGGTWNPPTGTGDQFTTSDQGNVSCGTVCPPIYKVIVTAGPLVFGVPPTTTLAAQGEFVKLTNSASVGIATGGIEDALAQENVDVALATELGTDTWRAYCGNLVPNKAIGQPPLTNQTKNSQSANIPLKFVLKKTTFVPASPGSPFIMESVGHGDEFLSDMNSDDACYLIHIPPPGGLLKNVADVTLTYTFVTGLKPTSYPTLTYIPPLPDFDYVDCGDACFRAYISLQDKFGVFKGRLKLYLGNASNFQAQHATGDCCSLEQLAGLADARVDASEMVGNLAQPCCMSFADAQKGSLGNLVVRAFVVVLDQGSADDGLNHRVEIQEASFNGSLAVSTNSLQVAGSEENTSCDWPLLANLQIAIFRLDDPGNPAGGRTLVHTVTPANGLHIEQSTCFLRGDVTVAELEPVTDPSKFEVWVQDGGVSIPNVGVMNISAL